MAAPTNYYVNPAIAGNSGTGTLLDPFGDLQYALDTIARDATNGDQINIKVGTAEVLAASLTLATYGTPAEGAPLVLRGYTSAAGDGGIAEVNCNGSTMIANAALTDLVLADLYMHNFGNNNGVYYYGARSLIYHCKLQKGASSPSGKSLINGVKGIIGCYVYDAGTTGNGIIVGNIAYGNYIYNCPVGINTSNYSAIRNIIVDCATGITVGDQGFVSDNTIYNSGSSTGTGISAAAGLSVAFIFNNIIEGYSGAGGKGISGVADIGLLGFNAFYNNTSAESLADVYIDLGNDATLVSSPFTNAAGGDFSLSTAVVGAIDGAFPGAWYGPAGTTDHADIGAVQNGAGAGGNVNHLRGKL